ncbi:hypothetical protein EXIGLDRAFT_758775 [Exidia glandulosa HHB12029]|uniref:Cupin type-2 domain-containing protein n=1 Tax=Exidia glandulosa HHB12029 TaxID=1314781 RepID=A0A165QCP6_EXIGL|nr:hypothetical protein EXIGLDRAFT_758775 [Exidia glandulosa HHB12029]
MSTSSDDNPSPLAPVRRVITGHTRDGKAIVLRDEVQQPVYWNPEQKNPTYDIHRSTETPARLDEEIVGDGVWPDKVQGTRNIVEPNGSVGRSHDFAPGFVVPMHRTYSLDYGVVMKGEITMILDDGARVVLKEGDIVVQRGTIHEWRNETNEWGRMIFVCLPSEKIVVDGKTQEDGFIDN